MKRVIVIILALFTSTIANAQHCTQVATFSTTSPRRIGMRAVNVSATLSAQQNLSFNQVLSPSNDLTNSMFGFMERTPKLVQRTSPDVSGIYGPPLPYVLCPFQTLAYQKTGTSFHDFYAPEVSNHYATQPIFAESNISARLLDPIGTQTFGQFCIASATDAQVLENIHFTDALGFTASYTDFDHSDNHTADVKLVDLNSEIRTTTTFAPTVWNTISPCGTPFPPGDPEGPFIVYNNSAMNMSIPTGGVTFSPSVGTQADWSTTLTTPWC